MAILTFFAANVPYRDKSTRDKSTRDVIIKNSISTTLSQLIFLLKFQRQTSGRGRNSQMFSFFLFTWPPYFLLVGVQRTRGIHLLPPARCLQSANCSTRSHEPSLKTPQYRFSGGAFFYTHHWHY